VSSPLPPLIVSSFSPPRCVVPSPRDVVEALLAVERSLPAPPSIVSCRRGVDQSSPSAGDGSARRRAVVCSIVTMVR